jgi:hypothetical protein
MRVVLASAAVPAVLAMASLAACGGNGNSASPGSSFCNDAQGVSQIGTLFNSAAATDINSLKSQFAAAASKVDQMDNDAPSDIATPMHTVRQFIDQINGTLQSASNTNDLINAFATQTNTTSADSAFSSVSTYAQQKCNVNISGSSSSSASSSS